MLCFSRVAPDFTDDGGLRDICAERVRAEVEHRHQRARAAHLAAGDFHRLLYHRHGLTHVKRRYLHLPVNQLRLAPGALIIQRDPAPLLAAVMPRLVVLEKHLQPG